MLLEDQDRALWDRHEIAAGEDALRQALALRAQGPYQLQAGIAAAHSGDESDWRTIATLYERLAEHSPTPVVELNRAVALAMAEGPEAGLELVDAVEGLDGYYLLHSARADLLRRLGRDEEARQAYERALELAPSDVERDFLRNRLAETSA